MDLTFKKIDKNKDYKNFIKKILVLEHIEYLAHLRRKVQA